jgi:DNA-binding NarL/FixJ family response regulator
VEEQAVRAKNLSDGRGTNRETLPNERFEAKSRRTSHQPGLSRRELAGQSRFGVSVSGLTSTRPFYAVLTTREREVLHLIAEGYSSKQIAAQLKVSTNTVNNHRAAMYARLGVHSATAAAKLYWDHEE